MQEGTLELKLDGVWVQAKAGDLVRMPRGDPHGYFNKSDKPVRALFWVSPARKLEALFNQLHELTDVAEVVRLSAEHEVDFCPKTSTPDVLGPVRLRHCVSAGRFRLRQPFVASRGIPKGSRTMVKQKNVCILAPASPALPPQRHVARGHRMTILERSGDLGGVWEPARSYPEVQTKPQGSLSVHRQAHAGYLSGMAERTAGSCLSERLCQTTWPAVANAVQHDRRRHGEARFKSAGWILEIRKANGGPSHEESDFVAVRAGQFNQPQTISHLRADAFKAAAAASCIPPNILTPPSSRERRSSSSADRNPQPTLRSIPSTPARAMSAGLSRAGVADTLFHRWARQFQTHSLHWRPGRDVPQLGDQRPLPRRACHRQALVRANWRGLESLLKVQLKLKACGMVPEQGIEDGVNCSVPIATPDFFPMVADGRIKAIRGTFERYDDKAIVMTGGKRVGADIAILAIGFKLGVPFLPEAYRNKLVEADGQYRLYRVIANPDLPDMGFVGFNSSFCTVLCAEMAANWLVRYCDGQLANQPTAAEMHRNMDMMLHFRRVERGEPATGRTMRRALSLQAFRRIARRHGRDDQRRNPLVGKFTPPMRTPMGVSWPRPRNTRSSRPDRPALDRSM